jgi:hypothetical protein
VQHRVGGLVAGETLLREVLVRLGQALDLGPMTSDFKNIFAKIGKKQLNLFWQKNYHNIV